MVLDESLVESILKHYDIGNLQQVISQLESGFSSDNYHIVTDDGNFALRVLHEAAERIEFGMLVHEYLDTHGIKTPRPERTKSGTLTHLENNLLIVIQRFISGEAIYEPLDAIDPLLPFYGQELGRIHSVLLKMTADFPEIKDALYIPFSWVRTASKQYMPDDEYVKDQYDLWKREIDMITDSDLTMGVVHADVGPKDFFFENGEFTGIMDFNSAQYGFLLYDVVSMMMYSELIRPEREEQYRIFINNYLKTSPIKLEELKWLHPFLVGRWFVQIFYHQYRYVEGITQGLERDETEENLVGVIEGIELLRITNKYSQDHFYGILIDE